MEISGLKFKRKYGGTQNGSALITILVFILLVSSATGLAFSMMRFHQREAAAYLKSIQLHHLAESGLHIALSKVRSGEVSLSFKSLNVITDTCTVKSKQKALKHEWISTAVMGKDSIQLRATIGYSSDDLFMNALSLTGIAPRLVISSGTVLEGDVALNDGQVFYSPPQVINQKPVYGIITEDSTFSDEMVNSTLLDSLFTRFHSALDNVDYSNYTVFESGEYSASDLKESHNIFVEGDLILRADSSEVFDLDTIITTHNLTISNRSKFIKPVTIISGENIFLKDKTIINNSILFAKSAIYVEDFSKIKGQLLSEKQVLITNRAVLAFPSYIVVPVNTEKVMGDPEVALLKHTSFSGMICVYESTKSKNIVNTFYLSGKVKKERSAKFSGGIFCNGMVELYGSIDGFIHADGLEQTVDQTRWINYLKNTQLYRYNISPDFPLPPVFSKQNQLTILDIQEIRE